MRQLALVIVGIVGVVVAAYSIASQARPSAEAAQMCLWVLDVGQGDAQLLSLPGGEWWMIDAGGWGQDNERFARQILLPQLRREGVSSIDRLVLTHSDADHIGGVRTLMEELPVAEVWIPTRRGQGRALARVVAQAETQGIPVHVVDESPPILQAPAPVQAEVLHPWPGWLQELRGEPGPNGGSLVLRVALGDASFLLTGDIEEAAEGRIVGAGGELRSAVLKVPHHGSRTSSSESFVGAVAPLIALAGASAGNRFGFPHASVAARYLQSDVPLYWTGRHGTLRVCTDGWTLSVDHRLRGGSWKSLRHWNRRSLGEWRGHRAGGRAATSALAPERAKEGYRLSSIGRAAPPARRRLRRCRSPSRRPESGPVLLEEREWDRHRRRRGNLR